MGGLGLAIVKRLCELIDAKVSVASEVGQGTCFRVSLPAAAADSISPEQGRLPTPEASLQGKRVYVVDDELDILKSMRTLLRVWGIDALTANSPPAAEMLFEKYGPPDLMIADLRLGEGEHGAHLADRLQHRYGNFPILIITGETSSQALLQANNRRFPACRGKPITPEVLRRAIAAAVVATVAA